MFRLQDRTALIPDVRNKTLTLIEREDDTSVRLCCIGLIGLHHLFYKGAAGPLGLPPPWPLALGGVPPPI
jgi:hypothetical protein